MRSSDPPEVPPAPPPDADIGPFRLANRIAVGGMAEVFRALQPQSAGEDRSVVIKRMLPALAKLSNFRRMFEHEADLGSAVRHDNVVEVIHQGTDRGVPYIVLEYVFGIDLSRLARHVRQTGQRLSIPVAVYIATEMLAGLAAVHAARGRDGAELHVVHRDVSPSNVFLSVHGDVKLGDLGIARALVREKLPSVLDRDRAKGKLGYLAPEQVSGDPFDQRADVFASAVIVAELLMGRPLFMGASEIAILLAIRDGNIGPFRETAVGLSPGLGLAVMAALERLPEERTQSASSFRDELLPYIEASVDEVRRELGDLIGKALAAAEPGEETFDRRALALTVEESVEGIQNVAMLPSPRPPPMPKGFTGRQLGKLFDLDSPAMVAPGEYEVHTASGEVHGPWRYARLVKAIATGEVGLHDKISFDGGTPCLVQEVTDLSRHLPLSTRTPSLRKRTAMSETSEVYTLRGDGILVALCQALTHRQTGLLLCQKGDVRKEVYLSDGVPVFLSSNVEGELLGNFLVERGVVDKDDLDLALAVMPRFEGRLGETLVALGLVDPVLLVRYIAEQVREKLLDIFVWTDGQAMLYLQVSPPASDFPLDLNIWELLEEGIARRIEAGLEGGRFDERQGHLLNRVDPLPVHLEAVALPDNANIVLVSLAAPRTLAELEGVLADPSGADPHRARRVIALLLSLGAIEWKE